MATLHETAYPRLKPDPTAKELDEIYTPSGGEVRLARSMATQPTTQLAVLIHLKMFQRLGYFVILADVPERIRQHIAQAAGLRRALSIRDLNRYDVSGAKRAHMARLRKFLRVRPLDVSGREWLATVAQAAAQTKHVIADIINVLLEELVHHRFELPGFSTLEKIAVQAREQVHEQYYRSINEALTAPAKSLIKELLAAPANATYTGWNALKREPKRPTNKEVRFYLQHIQRLQHLAQQLPAVDIPVPKLKQFRAMARALDASELAELKPAKRYALATIFIRSQYAKTLDDAADLYIRLMQNLENTAQQRLLAYQVEHGKRADTLIAQLKEILQAYQIDGTDTQRVDAIGLSLVADISTLLAECDEHMAYAGRNYLPFLIQPYSVVRPLLFNCLEIMQLRSTSQDAGMERMIAALLSLRGQRRDMIEASSIGLDVEKDLGWLSVNWRRHVFGRKADSLGPGWVHRKYFELAVLAQIKDELKSGDLFIPHGERYDD